MPPTHRSTTLRTPHLSALTAALAVRDHTFDVIAPDMVRVQDIAPDDLGWLAATAGVVVYEMVTQDNPPPQKPRHAPPEEPA